MLANIKMTHDVINNEPDITVVPYFNKIKKGTMPKIPKQKVMDITNFNKYSVICR
jgi:hypothetical protein